MTFRGFALGLALLVPSVAMAGPISVDGVWAPTASQSSDPLSQSLELAPFWGGVSWDGPLKGIGYLIKNEHGSDGRRRVSPQLERWRTRRFCSTSMSRSST